MNCSEVASVLDLRDSDARCDRATLARHVASCSACARRWPEVRWLAGDPPRPAWKRPGALAVAAAGIVALLAVVRGSGSDFRGAVPYWEPALTAEAAPPREDGPSVGVVTRESVTLDQGRRVASSVSYTVWRPPPPRCLMDGGSGT